MNKIITFIIIPAVIISALAIGLNFLPAGGQQSKNTLPTPSILYSEAVSMSTQGAISKIEGNKITINSRKGPIALNFKNNTVIYAVNMKGVRKPTAPEPWHLKDLKVGDSVMAGFKLLPNNILEGDAITLIPPLNNFSK